MFDWYLREVLNLSEDAPRPEQPPAEAASLIGTFVTVSRTIHVQRISGATLTAVVEDTGPTWGGTSTFELEFRAGQRLEGTDGTRMEYGTLPSGKPWLRYRGRIHVQP